MKLDVDATYCCTCPKALQSPWLLSIRPDDDDLGPGEYPLQAGKRWAEAECTKEAGMQDRTGRAKAGQAQSGN